MHKLLFSRKIDVFAALSCVSRIIDYDGLSGPKLLHAESWHLIKSVAFYVEVYKVADFSAEVFIALSSCIDGSAN